ncbi:hypothetical protein DESC_260071 [Desulfosarcina cetonica]|nr:hypothetical protein DESC_260071 [Desulfosarcina cetonica]
MPCWYRESWPPEHSCRASLKGENAVPFKRRKTRHADRLRHHLPGQPHRRRRTGQMGNALLTDGAIHIVRAPAEPGRARCQPGHGPVGFQVRQIIQHQPRDGQDGQGLERRRPLGDEIAGTGLKRQRDKIGEAARHLLGAPQDQQMFDTLGPGIAKTEKHGGIGGDPLTVGHLMDAYPILGAGLVLPMLLVEAFGEDLGATPGHGVHAGGLELIEHRRFRQAAGLGEVFDLHGRIALDVHVGETLAQTAHQLKIARIGPDLIEPANDVHFGGAEPIYLVKNFRFRQHVGMRCVFRGGIITKRAAAATNVRGVDLHIEHIAGLVAKPRLAVGQGRLAQAVQPLGCNRLGQGKGFLPGQALATGAFFQGPVE